MVSLDMPMTTRELILICLGSWIVICRSILPEGDWYGTSTSLGTKSKTQLRPLCFNSTGSPRIAMVLSLWEWSQRANYQVHGGREEKNRPNMFNISFHKYLQLQHIFRPNWFQLVLNPLVLELVYTFSLEGIIAADLKLLPPLLWHPYQPSLLVALCWRVLGCLDQWCWRWRGVLGKRCWGFNLTHACMFSLEIGTRK